MKRYRLLLIASLLAALILPLFAVQSAYADHCNSDQRIMGDTYVLGAGEVLNSNLIVLGGNATIEAGAQVECSVVIVGGNLDLAGTVDEDVVVFGGNATLQPTAVVAGELINFGGATTRSAGSEVRGGESQGFSMGNDPRGDRFPFSDRVPSFFRPVLSFYGGVLEAFLTAVGLGLLALLVMLFWPEQTARVGAAAMSAPAAAGGLGLLTAIAVPVLIVLSVLTICLAPFGFVGAMVFAAAMIFGLIALGHIVGARLAAALKLVDVSPAVAAALGTSLLSLAMRVVAEVPCVGWVAPLVLSAIGLGAVTLTRFGTRPYLPSAPPSAPPPALQLDDAPAAS